MPSSAMDVTCKAMVIALLTVMKALLVTEKIAARMIRLPTAANFWMISFWRSLSPLDFAVCWGLSVVISAITASSFVLPAPTGGIGHDFFLRCRSRVEDRGDASLVKDRHADRKDRKSVVKGTTVEPVT